MRVLACRLLHFHPGASRPPPPSALRPPFSFGSHFLFYFTQKNCCKTTPSTTLRLCYISGSQRRGGSFGPGQSLLALPQTPYSGSHGGNNYILTCNLDYLNFPFHLLALCLLLALTLSQSIFISITERHNLSFLEKISGLPGGLCDDVKKSHTPVHGSCQVLYVTKLSTNTGTLRAPDLMRTLV